jgi:serine/threonine-protein kinase
MVSDVSTVFLARDLRLDRQVLLEIFHPEGFGSAEEVARFTWRTRADELKSEHVRRILDAGIWDSGSPYVTSEFLEGRDLAEWLQRRGALPESQAVDFVIQACDALAEAHLLGIVRRDIKPSNLFAVERPSVEASIKVLGWDLWLKLESEATKQKSADNKPEGGMVEARVFGGTPLYMPPEQWQGTPDLDARADIWALGVTLCELVTGHVPFEGASLMQLYSVITAGHGQRHRSVLPPTIEPACRLQNP